MDYGRAMGPRPLAALRSPVVVTVLLTGCLSRWSGCRTYDTGHLTGPNWNARVTCVPHTEVSVFHARNEPTFRGCTARWGLSVERAGDPRLAELQGPPYASRDCGDVRRRCATSHGELAQRVTSVGTWVAARAPGGPTKVAFVPDACGVTQMLPDDTAPTRSPEAAVAERPDGATFIDGIIAHAPITSDLWRVVCGAVLTARVAAVRAAALECRTPDDVAEVLFTADPGSVEALWHAVLADRLPCSDQTRRDLRRLVARPYGETVLRSLATCTSRPSSRACVESLREAGELRLSGASTIARAVVDAGPPRHVPHDAPGGARAAYEASFDAWRLAHWTLVRVDPHGGTEAALSTLRRLPASEGDVFDVRRTNDAPTGYYDDPASALCEIALQGDATVAREGFAEIAADEGASVGVRQRCLLSLARMGDARGTGSTLAHNPLTAEQSAAIAHTLAPTPSGGNASGGGHHSHHHHW
jgi:hypothetical protein